MAGQAEREQTPARLRRIEELINTRGLVFDVERLDSPSALADWLTERDLLPSGTRTGEADLERTIRLREGLRALLIRNNPGADAVSDVERRITELTALMRELPLVVDVGVQPPRLMSAGNDGVDVALATIVGAIPDAVANGTWSRLKVCRRPDCRFAYYDHSRNRARAWCDMSTCGNQAKVRAFRQRERDR